MGVALILFALFLFCKGFILWADGALLMDRVCFFIGMISLICGVYM